MDELTKANVAQKVRDYLRDRHVAGITLRVDENDVTKVNSWWRVPVRPSSWPERMFEYYEALADVEAEIQEKENLNILLATGEPEEFETVSQLPNAQAA